MYPHVDTTPAAPLSRAPARRSVLVVDDHPGFRIALENLLARAGDLEVVGSASDGAQAVELAAQLRPDLVVMDLAMPVLSGVDAIRRIRSQHEPPVVVALSGSRAMWREARAAGVSCTILKDEDPEQLVATIRAAIAA
jgi:DNA-binding NarL/FixJ family response regulator